MNTDTGSIEAAIALLEVNGYRVEKIETVSKIGVEKLDAPIEELGLPHYILVQLKDKNIHFVHQLVCLPIDYFYKMIGLSSVGFASIYDAVYHYGLKVNIGVIIKELDNIPVLRSHIDALSFSKRIFNALIENRITHVYQLIARSRVEILGIPNIGRESISEIEQVIKGLGLSSLWGR